MTQNRRFFTLLEIMLTLAILGIIASFMGLQVYRLIHNSRFEKEISCLYTRLQEAQVLSSAYQTDIDFDVFEEKGCFYYQFSTAEPFSKEIFSQDKKKLSLVRKISSNGSEQKKIHCILYAGGRIDPGCILSFTSSLGEDPLALYLDLSTGYLVKFSHNPPNKRTPI